MYKLYRVRACVRVCNVCTYSQSILKIKLDDLLKPPKFDLLFTITYPYNNPYNFIFKLILTF